MWNKISNPCPYDKYLKKSLTIPRSFYSSLFFAFYYYSSSINANATVSVFSYMIKAFVNRKPTIQYT